MKKSINAAERTVTFTFEGYADKEGKVLDAGLAPVVIKLGDVSQANVTYAALHGLSARIGDNAAIPKSAENGFVVTEAMRRGEVEAMVKFYANQDNVDWNMRVAAAPKAAPFNPAIQAIAAKLGKSYAEAMAWYNEKLLAELAGM
jgi:hypothetical protein